MGTEHEVGRRAGRLRVREVLTVQLPPHLLRAGELPRVAVGGTLEAAPALCAGVVAPMREEARDFYDGDELGTVVACGTVMPALLQHGSGDRCRVDVLDTGGRLLPLNWAATEPLDGRVYVEGGLYLDGELAPGTEHGEAIALCRRVYRVAAVRRYRRTTDRPAGPVPLRRLPSPAEAHDDAVFVVDLVAPARP